MKKVCITGADGFIGHCLSKYFLEQGREVWAVGIFEENMKDIKSDKLHFIKATFEEYNSLVEKLPNDLDCFYHFAWNGVFGEKFKNYELQLNNCKYACDSLMIAKKINCKKFVLASTVNVLEVRNYMTMNTFSPRYTNIYAMAKLSSEMMCKTLAFQNNIEFNCGLIAMVYGENNKSLMIPNVVMTNLLTNKESNLVPYDTPYDLIYVDDVAKAFIAIGENGINQKTYYVGHSKLSTFGQIFDSIKNIVNPNAKINYGVYPDTNAIDYNLINLKALEEDTGFVADYDFEKSIKNTVNWLKNAN